MWPLTPRCPLCHVVEDGYVIAEEFGLLVLGVGDQGLVLGQFKFEVISQEFPQPRLDRLCFRNRPVEPKEKVVGVPDVAQPAVVGIELILRPETFPLFD